MLVDYSDSESEVGDEQPLKRRKVKDTQVKGPPPLPASFHSLYGANVRAATADDPSLHGGRSRQVPHIEGNWPSHVYLEWLPNNDSLIEIRSLIDTVQKDVDNPSTVHSFLQSDLNVHQPLHVSLSAPLVLTTDQKDAFRDAMISTVESSNAHAFNVTPNGLSWVSNFDESRYFLVLKLAKPADDDLNRLLRACNACASSWGMDRLYPSSAAKERAKDMVQPSDSHEDRSSAFHISIAWTLQIPADMALESMVTRVNGSLRDTVITFSSVKIKIGNVVSDVPLVGQS